MSEDDDTMYSLCPRCGVAVDDCDGHGVLFHPACGYCKHPAKTDGVCGLCGKEVGL